MPIMKSSFLKSFRCLCLSFVFVVGLIAIIASGGGGGSGSSDNSDNNNDNDITAATRPTYTPFNDDWDYDLTGAVNITLNGDLIIADSAYVTVNGSIATITSSGTYNITGNLNDGQIIVNNADADEGVVRLYLNGVDISCADSSPIYNMTAQGTLIVVLSDGTSNYITDQRPYSAVAVEPDAAVFSYSDMVISGDGSLNVVANYNNGIKSKDELIIDKGAVTVDSVDDGITGRDYIAVEDGDIIINAEGDGLKSTNDEDTEMGYVIIDKGIIDIFAGADAIQAETDIVITGGEISLYAGGGSGNTIAADATGKGIKAAEGVFIDAGIITVDSADDAVHANLSIEINGGEFYINVQDERNNGEDAFHADGNLTINDGEISIYESYEGLEGAIVTINGGDIHIVSSDDGINGAGGRDLSGSGGQDNFLSYDGFLYINGGYIMVNAQGDGIDVNGPVEMTDGDVIIHGPTADNNGALDHYSFKISGGFLLAAGSSGMALAPSETSTQYSVSVKYNSRQDAGILFHIRTDAGEIVTFAPGKRYQSVVFSSPELTTGTEYNIYSGGSSTGTVVDGVYYGGSYSPGTRYDEFTISNIVTNVGSGGGGMPF